MESDSIFRVVLLAILVPTLAVVAYHRIHAATPEKLDRRQEGIPLAITLRLAGLAAWVAMLAWLVSPDSAPWTRVALPSWARWAGAAMGAGCPFLMWWVMHALGKNLTDTVVTRAEATLVTDGPYRWVRHPFYGAFGVLAASASLVAANWFVGATCLAALALLAIRTRKEEAKLVERFGDAYREYARRTGRFLPKPM